MIGFSLGLGLIGEAEETPLPASFFFESDLLGSGFDDAEGLRVVRNVFRPDPGGGDAAGKSFEFVVSAIEKLLEQVAEVPGLTGSAVVLEVDEHAADAAEVFVALDVQVGLDADAVTCCHESKDTGGRGRQSSRGKREPARGWRYSVRAEAMRED